MLSITYVSAAAFEMSDEAIGALLTHARSNNTQSGLTGVLLYHRGRFIQILEGPDDQVQHRFDVIAADPRHRSVQKVAEERIAERRFPEWTMGFRPLTDARLQELPGYQDFFGRSGKARLEHAENSAHQLLEWLTEYWFAPA